MPNQNNTQWTDALTARLRELHANGDSFSIIAADLGMTRSMVAGRCRRLGLAFSPRGERRALVQQRAPRPAPPLPAPPIEPLRLLLTDLRRTSCRWVDDDRTFCGHQTAGGSYCAGHAALVYRRAA
jgi:hypothetical protein